MTVSILAVVGTGTSIGKTHLTAALGRVLGPPAVAVKPIESGVDGTTTTDADILAAATRAPRTPPPFQLRDPVSPHLAARRAGLELDLDRAAAWCRVELARGTVLVETAGALLSPLGRGRTNLDLVLALDPDRVLLLGLDRLGVLHEVEACLRCLRPAFGRRLRVALVTPPQPDASTGTNADEIVALGIAPTVTVVARGSISELAASASVRALAADLMGP